MKNKLNMLIIDIENKTFSDRFRGAKIKNIKLNYSECEDLKFYCNALLNGSYKEYLKPIGNIVKVFKKYNIELPNEGEC